MYRQINKEGSASEGPHPINNSNICPKTMFILTSSIIQTTQLRLTDKEQTQCKSKIILLGIPLQR